MVHLSLQCVLWGCLLAVVHPDSTACKTNQYLLNNKCCDMCPPGQKITDDCTEHHKTQCLPCGKGEFLDKWNREKHCHQHQYCEPHSGLTVLREGTSVTDTTCTCKEAGLHCTGNPCESCVPNTLCGPGFGVKEMATGTFDTICEGCPFGFFSNVSSAVEKCRPWTSCEATKLVVLQEGTNQTDVVCGLQPRERKLLAIPIVMGVLIAVTLFSVYIRKVAKKSKARAFHPEPVRHHPDPTWGDPVEVDFLGHNPAAPIQETLHGCQPVTQEDGKESRISVQERQ